MKKLLALLLSVMMLTGSIAPVYGSDFTDGGSAEIQAPQISAEKSAVPGTDESAEMHTTSKSVFDEKMFTGVLGPNYSSTSSKLKNADTSVINAAAVMRKYMVQRQVTIKVTANIPYYATERDVWKVGDAILEQAFKETGKSYEGDYLYWNVSGYNASASYGGGKSTYTYIFKYLSTTAQEVSVTVGVKNVLSSMKFTGGTSDYNKIKKLHDYVCRQVEYDYKNLNNSAYLRKHSAYAALFDRTAVCQGYALLYHRLLREAGILTRIIVSENHMWNIVRLRGWYYNVDTTWDDKSSYIDYDYFLKTDKTIMRLDPGGDHIREYGTECASSSFRTLYPTASSDYVTQPADTKENIAAAKFSYKTSWVCTGKALKPKVTVNYNGRVLKQGTDYTLSYSNNKNPGIAKVTVKGIGKYTGSRTGVFAISFAEVKMVSAKSAAYNKIKVTWKKVPGAAGYYVYRRLGNSAWALVGAAKSSKNTFTDASVATGLKYTYIVRAYRKTSAGLLLSPFSGKGVSGKASLAKPAIKSITNPVSRGQLLQWKPVAGASGYQVQIQASINGKTYRTLRVTSKTYFGYTNLVKGVRYYYRIRPYKFLGKVAVYGPWSAVKSKIAK